MRYRTKTKFLWFPKQINGKWKWLQTATWREKEVECHGCRPGLVIKEFRAFEWVEESDLSDWGYKDHFPRR